MDPGSGWQWEVRVRGGWSGVVLCQHPACQPAAFRIGPGEPTTSGVESSFADLHHEVLESWTLPDGRSGATLRRLPSTPCPE